MFPSSVQPPVLGWVFSYELLYSLSVLSRDPYYGVWFVFPFLGHDDSVYSDFEVKTVVDATAVTYADGCVVCYSEQCNAFVCACLSAEEVDENTLSPGVLIGYEAECCAGGGDFWHHLRGAFFVDDFLTGSLSDAVEVVVNVFVVEWSCDAVDVESEESEHVADNLEISIVGGEEYEAAIFLYEPFCSLDVFVAGVFSPVALFYDAWG